jgi:hypothetical protein
VIILILNQVRALPATVLSRCQIVRFRPRAFEGAVALLPGGDGEGRDRALGWLAQAQTRGVEAVLQIGETVGRDREAAQALVETCWLWYRDLLCALGGADARLAVFAGKAVASGRSLDEVVSGSTSVCLFLFASRFGAVGLRLLVRG